MDRLLRIEILINKVLDLDLYFRDMKQLHLSAMNKIQEHHAKVVGVGTSSSENVTSEPEFD